MPPADNERSYQFKALTDLWTGSAAGKPERLVATVLLGSIRWWLEVLVRGLGGSACDPTATKCESRNHCMVCELFGCTGWARKFRFEVLNEQGNTVRDQIRKNQTFSFRLTPLRPLYRKEWVLLDTTLRMIAEYGAMGGKTVLKPTDEPGRMNKPYHKDYGLVRLDRPRQFDGTSRDALAIYLSKWCKLNHAQFAWASLQHFWCVKERYLARQNSNKSTFNRIIGRPEFKGRNGQEDSWLAGRRSVSSKKIFSFKTPPRTFGFVKPGLINFSDMKQDLKKVWKEDGWVFLTGEEVINRLLFAGKENTS
jgi:CRISPR-associated protein Cmr1